MSKLAVEGGTPLRVEPYPPRKQIDKREILAVMELMLDAEEGGAFDRYGGVHVDAYEQEFAHYVGVPYATACSAGTAAIHTALGALQIEPFNANIWYNKGMVLEKMERNNESLEAYRRAIDLDEGLDRAWFRQGHVLMRLGRNSKALKCFQKAAQLDPANSLYQQSLQDMGALTMNDLDVNGLAANGLDMDDLAVDLQENMLDFSASSARPGRIAPRARWSLTGGRTM